MATLTRHVLKTKESFLLTNLILAEFQTANMTDSAFAEYATKKLGLNRPLTDRHITNIRHLFDIPAYKSPPPPKRLTFADRIESCEAACLALLSRVEHLEKIAGAKA